MFDQFFVPEIQKNYKIIEELEKELSEEKIIERHAVFKDRVAKIMEYSRIAKKKGLLPLEEKAKSIDENGEDALIKRLITQIVDGTDPEMIERWAMYDYASKIRNPYEGILYIITVCGMRAIQSGERRRFLAMLMNSMTPSDIAIDPGKYEEVTNSDEPEDKYKDIEEYCSGEIRVSEGGIGYIEISAVDSLFRTISDRGVQRLLREITNGDLAKLMPGLSGEARKKIFNNMSRRLSLMVLEDIRVMGAYDDISDWILESSKDAANIILKIALKLREQGDIVF